MHNPRRVVPHTPPSSLIKRTGGFVLTAKAAHEIGKQLFNLASHTHDNRKRYQSRPRANSAPMPNSAVKVPIKSFMNTGKTAYAAGLKASAGGTVSRVPRVRKSKSRRIGKNGINFTMEVGGQTSSQQAAYIGHVTAPIQQIINYGAMSVIKQLFHKAQFDVSGPQTALGSNVNDSFVVFYQSQEEAFLQSATYNLDPGDTLATITTWFTAGVRPWGVETTSISDQYTIYSFKYIPVDTATSSFTPAYILLRDVKIQFAAKSALKIQNRTVTVVADIEADDVDNVPLSGKIYQGPGTGMTLIRKPSTTLQNATFMADNRYGTILQEYDAQVTPTVSGVPVEPPEDYQVTKVTHSSGVTFNPGLVKTSILRWSKTMSFNTFWQNTHPHGFGVTFKIRKSMGNFRIFGMEKMIHFSSTDSAIQTVYEHNYELSTNAVIRPRPISLKAFEAFRDQNL
jgi:hypothetical protein